MIILDSAEICRVGRKPVFRVSDQVQHKLGYTATEYGQRLKISDLESRGIVLCSASKGLFSHMQKKTGFLMTLHF